MTTSSGNIFPTIGNYYVQNDQWLSDVPITSSAKICKGHVSNSNPIIAYSDQDGSQTGTFTTSVIDQSMNYWGYGNNIRGEYNTKFIENKFP
ncbi:MAG TPA: hypothetical protein PKL30_18680 [Leptospiraceae bacterium]|nr:hypothetical protein [Leptospiraceae bacterium]